MLEVAEIFRRHGAAYRARSQLLPSQARAIQDIEACRTAYFGGHLKQCDHCGGQVYAYHSCRNRHCPKCHGDQTARWRAQQETRLLPCPYFLVTFTLPAELRPLAFAQQKIVYGLLMRCAGAALQKLALDPQYLCGRLGALVSALTKKRRNMNSCRRGRSRKIQWRVMGSEFMTEVVNIGRGEWLVEEFVDYWEEVMKGADRVEWREGRVAQQVAGGGQQEGGFDERQGDVSLAELSGEEAVVTGVTMRRIR